jgi:hypothetical protein
MSDIDTEALRIATDVFARIVTATGGNSQVLAIIQSSLCDAYKSGMQGKWMSPKPNPTTTCPACMGTGDTHNAECDARFHGGETQPAQRISAEAIAEMRRWLNGAGFGFDPVRFAERLIRHMEQWAQPEPNDGALLNGAIGRMQDAMRDEREGPSAAEMLEFYLDELRASRTVLRDAVEAEPNKSRQRDLIRAAMRAESEARND